MIQMILYIITLLVGMIFMQMIHPLAMGLMLLIQTLMVCLMTGLLSKTFWFSYILFLIFMGGMLVLFIYVTSLASNEMFSMSMKTTLLSLMMFLVFMGYTMLTDYMSVASFHQNNEMVSTLETNSYIMENSLNLNSLYNYPVNYMTIMLMIYLLITLIAVVKITNMHYGSIRSMN
nr:NADH dehydrogenase subunit 6 [Euprosopia sp. PH-2020]